MPHWIKNLSPDITQTFNRFPFAIVLSFLSTIVAIGLTNDLIPDSNEVWLRVAFGLSVGAVFAVAGTLYGESKRPAGPIFVLLSYVLPVLAAALMQVESTQWLVAPMLAPLSLLWLSVASFTHIGKGKDRATNQNKFWWMNHRAITTAVIAGIGFALISVGLVAIERAMAMLFSIRSSRLFYEILLPFTGLFLTPVYWLSTIPKLSEYSPNDISEPDFLSRAIGFLGQFILTPFLFIYALILLAYAAQIVLTMSLPQGTLSWMVLGFTIVGAANWLVLHPEFMHSRPLVKVFRKTWFWLTLIPATLYVIGVWLRIDAYGLTYDRVGLVAGGIWIVTLSLSFLTKKIADIRLIPVLALAIICFFSIGPWNFIHLSQTNQAARLSAAIQSASSTTRSATKNYDWNDKTIQTVEGSVRFLLRADRDSEILKNTLLEHNIKIDPDNFGHVAIYKALQMPEPISDSVSTSREISIGNRGVPTDVSSTPIFLGRAFVYAQDGGSGDVAHLTLKLVDGKLSVEGPSHVATEYSLDEWLSTQSDEEILNSTFEFIYQEVVYRLVMHKLRIHRSGGNEPVSEIIWFDAALFSQIVPPANLPPVNLTSQ